MGGCSDPPPAPAPAPTRPTPTHPSGASARDLEVFHWIGTEGARLQAELSERCGIAITECAYSRPGERVACFDRVFPPCDRALASAEAAAVPEEIADGLLAQRNLYRGNRCTYGIGAEALRADPALGRRLRPRDIGGYDSMETLIFDDADRGRAWAIPLAERLTSCPSFGDTLGATVAWLNQRFSCAVPHPQVASVTIPRGCTVDVVGEMVAAGVEPGPPERR